MNSQFLTRRVFLASTLRSVPFKANNKAIIPVNGSNNSLESDVLYVYQTDRFRAMYVVSDNDNKSVTVRQRVDWYDPITDEPISKNESNIYITDYGGEN
jgi:hypothetical protein